MIDPKAFLGGKFASILDSRLSAAEIEFELERHFSLNETLGFRSYISIAECGEPLLPLTDPELQFFSPHPYQSIGAPYGGASPFALRSGAAERLRSAQGRLSKLRPGFRLKVFDGYRPLEVQAFMVELTYSQIAVERGFDPGQMAAADQDTVYSEVFKLFARPNPDPDAPPPHSTGGAVDLTILDASGVPLEMGSAIDAMPPLALPHYFHGRTDPESKRIQANRDLLRDVMVDSGFERLPREWWHFSYGDQGWALIRCLKERKQAAAIYGRVSGLPTSSISP